MSDKVGEISTAVMASELSFLNEYFSDFIEQRDIVERISKDKLEHICKEFTSCYVLNLYTKADLGCATPLDTGVLNTLLDNYVDDLQYDAVSTFEDVLTRVLATFEGNKVTINKFLTCVSSEISKCVVNLSKVYFLRRNM